MKAFFKSLLCLPLLFSSYIVNSAVIENFDNGHYYEVFSGAYTWELANAEASNRKYKGLQGHLATITSSSENSWITNHLEGYEGTFIGATDSASEGKWEWVTGEEFSFSNWEPGEPNSWNGLNEDYLMYWWANDNDFAGWNDTTNDPFSDVEFELGYIVEYETSAVPIPAAVWLFGSSLLGIIGLTRKKRIS